MADPVETRILKLLAEYQADKTTADKSEKRLHAELLKANKEKGLSVRYLADLTGLSRSWIALIVTGKAKSH